MFPWAASLGYCSCRNPILLISSRTGSCLAEMEMRNICHIYCYSLMVGEKTSLSQNPRSHLDHCLSLQPHVSNWLTSSFDSLSQICSLCSISTVAKFWGQFFFPELWQQSSHWPLPWSHLLPINFLDASRNANVPSLKILKWLHWLQKDTQTSWEAFKEFHKLDPASQCHLSKTHPIF